VVWRGAACTLQDASCAGARVQTLHLANRFAGARMWCVASAPGRARLPPRQALLGSCQSHPVNFRVRLPKDAQHCQAVRTCLNLVADSWGSTMAACLKGDRYSSVVEA